MAGSSRFRQGRREGRLWRWTGAAVVTTLAFLVTEETQSRTTQAHLDDQAQAIAAHLGVVLARPLESLHALRALFQTPTFRVRKEDFARFLDESLKRHPEVTMFEWAPSIEETDRALFETWMRNVEPEFRIWAPGQDANGANQAKPHHHIPITYSAPDNPSALGLDLAALPNSGYLARESLQQGKVTVSDRYQLTEGNAAGLSVVIYAPVKGSHWAAVPGSDDLPYPDGVVVLIFRLESLMDGALAHFELKGLGLKLEDKTARPERRDLYGRGTLVGEERSRAQVPFAGRVYEITVALSSRRSPLPPLGAALAILVMSAIWIRLIDLRTRTKQLSRTLETLGQYKLEQKIATGGMGTVYRGQHALLKRPAAIKIAHKDQSATHLEREARLHSTLNHPNTVTVFDFGRGDDGTFYVAMEYVEGYDLYRLVTSYGPLPPGRAVRILLQTAASLEEAHKKGLVHRDVKPSNIMITERGGLKDFVKVLDFGLARSNLTEPHSLSSASANTLFVGTPGYIAPEIIVGALASPASDIFSLGCVGYFLISGRGPFDAPSPMSVLGRVMSGNAHPIPQGTPKPFSDFIERCLQKRPEDRPLSMGAVALQLRTMIPALPAWTPEDAELFWGEHPPVSPQNEKHEGFSVVLRDARSAEVRGDPDLPRKI